MEKAFLSAWLLGALPMCSVPGVNPLLLPFPAVWVTWHQEPWPSPCLWGSSVPFPAFWKEQKGRNNKENARKISLVSQEAWGLCSFPQATADSARYFEGPMAVSPLLRESPERQGTQLWKCWKLSSSRRGVSQHHFRLYLGYTETSNEDDTACWWCLKKRELLGTGPLCGRGPLSTPKQQHRRGFVWWRATPSVSYTCYQWSPTLHTDVGGPAKQIKCTAITSNQRTQTGVQRVPGYNAQMMLKHPHPHPVITKASLLSLRFQGCCHQAASLPSQHPLHSAPHPPLHMPCWSLAALLPPTHPGTQDVPTPHCGSYVIPCLQPTYKFKVLTALCPNPNSIPYCQLPPHTGSQATPIQHVHVGIDLLCCLFCTFCLFKCFRRTQLSQESPRGLVVLCFFFF